MSDPPPHTPFRHFTCSKRHKTSHIIFANTEEKTNPEGLNPLADAENEDLVGKQGCSSKMLHIVSNPEHSLQSIWGDF